MSIYEPCGIRGRAETELTPELYRRWGLALGRRVEPTAKFVVGGDRRASTPQFLAALIDGLCESGVDVVDLGQLPTPMVYYARRRLQAVACAMVTGSHHASGVNGLKWMIGRQPPTPDDVDALRRDAESLGSAPAGRVRTSPRELDISFDYVAWLQETWIDSLDVRCHVVLDPMHGCFAARARRYLHAIFPQCLFSTIHDAADPALAGRNPDCGQPHLLQELCEEVYRERAHAGIAFDGDGGRVALVDNEGMTLSSEEAAWALLQSFGRRLEDEQFVYDLNYSDCVAQTAGELGAEPLAERSGHAFLCRRMLATNALFGAEASGHYFFRALEGGDDALFTACWVIAYLARCGTTLAHVRRECPPVYMTPDLRVTIEPSRQQAVIGKVREAWSQSPQQTIDGVRIDTPGGRALVRISPTEPALTFRFESADWRALDHLVERFCQLLPDLGDQLWQRYRAAMGSAGQRP